MSEFFSQFHVLRPLWLLALLPSVALVLLLWRQRRQARQWQQLIDPGLLPYLLDGNSSRTPVRHLLALALAWLPACIALAGPSWEKRPVAIEKNQQALVIILDLSPSMLSEDLKPSRLTRARLKIIDMLQRRPDGYTGLVVYAGDAHAVMPLSEDKRTIINLLPDLSPHIMPLSGSNTEAAVARALQMLRDGQASKGELLLITDGVANEAQASVIALLKQAPGISLSVLGIGGTQPAPIPSSKGGFVRDRDGSIVTTQIEPAALRSLALASGGRYHTFTDTSADIDYLASGSVQAQGGNASSESQQRQFDSWYDRGHWLALLLLPIILYSFRRGLLLNLISASLLGLLLAAAPQPSYALTWQDLWLNKNQQGQQALQQQQNAAAAELFNDPQWKASAAYRAGDYDSAINGFAQDDSARGHYNRGNALAHSGKLDEALQAYDEALKRDPTLADAQHNRALVEAAKQQQQEQQPQQGDQNQDGDNQSGNDQSGENQPNDNKNSDSTPQKGSEKNSGDNSQDQSQQGNNSADADNSQGSGQQEASSDGEALSDEEKAAEAQRQKDEEAQRQQEKAQRQTQQDAQESQQQTEQEAAASQSDADNSAENANEQAYAQQPDDGLSNEERQAMEQWLRRVPDEPGLLLKNKFQDQYRKRRLQMYNGQWEAPENGAAERW